jgi:hypothetical protein
VSTFAGANKLKPMFLSSSQGNNSKSAPKIPPFAESVKGFLEANGVIDALNSQVGEQTFHKFLNKHAGCLPECQHLDSLLTTLVKRKALPLAEIKINA